MNMDKKLQEIAKDKLNIPTLESRNMDNLDFHEIAVWQLEEALVDAYVAGYKAGKYPEKSKHKLIKEFLADSGDKTLYFVSDVFTDFNVKKIFHIELGLNYLEFALVESTEMHRFYLEELALTRTPEDESKLYIGKKGDYLTWRCEQ